MKITPQAEYQVEGAFEEALIELGEHTMGLTLLDDRQSQDQLSTRQNAVSLMAELREQGARWHLTPLPEF